MNTRTLSLVGFLLVAIVAVLGFSPRSPALQPAATEQAPIADEAAPGSDNTAEAAPAQEELPPALDFYLGREIAQTMHYSGAEWLTRESRDREEDCTTMLASLGIEPGMTVCDMGCGNGFYTLKLGELVGEEGRVLAVDIQPEMLTLLRERAHVTELENIEPVLGSLINPHLPEGEVDIILCVDVYHEFSHPVHMLEAMRESLAPGGRLVLVEFRSEDPNVPIKPLHKMSREQMLLEMTANRFELVEEFEELPWQHMLFFEATSAEVAPETPAEEAAEPTAEPTEQPAP